MKIISHRGLVDGNNSLFENNPSHIEHILNKYSFDVEVDLWKVGNQFFLGHERPFSKVDLSFLVQHKNRLWIHCKNDAAFEFCYSSKELSLNYFWHDMDKYIFTSKGYLWNHYCNSRPFNNSVALLFSLNEIKDLKDLKEINYYAICTDYCIELKNILNEKSK